MSAANGIVASVIGVILLGMVVMGVLGYRSIGNGSRGTAQAGYQMGGRTLAVRRRDSRHRKREQAALLPADATVSFGAERRAAGIDEVFHGLDADLVGLVPVKQKVQ